MSDIQPIEDMLSDEIDQFLGTEEAEEQEEVEQEDDALADDDAESEGEDSGEEIESEETSDEIPPPPHSWSKEDAAVWAELTPEQRAVVQRREAERDKFVADVGRKGAEARRTIEREAMEAVAQHAETFSQQLEQYAQMFAPEAPDARLLYTGDQDDVLLYQRQDAAYRVSIAQQQELQQRIALSQQQAVEARKQANAALSQQEAELLRDALPEFFDPEAGPKLRQSLESIGQELGYTPDIMAQAGASDIVALKKVADMKVELDTLRAFKKRIDGKTMETVRAAKQLPRLTRPGASLTNGQKSAGAREGAWQKVKDSKDPNAFADWLGL